MSGRSKEFVGNFEEDLKLKGGEATNINFDIDTGARSIVGQMSGSTESSVTNQLAQLVRVLGPATDNVERWKRKICLLVKAWPEVEGKFLDLENSAQHKRFRFPQTGTSTVRGAHRRQG